MKIDSLEQTSTILDSICQDCQKRKLEKRKQDLCSSNIGSFISDMCTMLTNKRLEVLLLIISTINKLY